VIVYVLEYSRSDTPRTEDGDASSVDEVMLTSCLHHTWFTVVISDYLRL